MKVTIRPLKRVSLAVFRRFWQLCADCEEHSYTRWALKRWLSGIYENRWAVTATMPNGVIAGWALVTSYPENKEAVDFKIFVDPDYRRQGVGKAITDAAKKRFGKLDVYVPTAGATAFYKAIKL